MLLAFFQLPALLRTHQKVQSALAQLPFDQVLAQFTPQPLSQTVPQAADVLLARFFTRFLRRYAGRFRGKSACLDQSIALRQFLAEIGIASVLKIGVKRQPFAAHAWLEINDVPVLEANHVKRDFVCFDSLPEGTIALLNPALSKLNL